MGSEAAAWRVFLRRHQRRLILGYLVIVGLGLLAIVLPPSRRRLLAGVERTVRWWDDRWARRLERGQALLGSGAVDQAVDYLAKLDAVHPATNVRHARDKEREKLLRLLAMGYERQGKSGRAIETYQRLVGFDSLNYRNHLELARAAERLLSGWALAPEARDAYQRVLALFPSHLPAIRGYVDYYQDRGEFIPVVNAFQTYLDAHLVQPVVLSIGAERVEVPVLVDGVVRDFEVPLVSPNAAESLTVDAGGFAFVLDRIEVVPAARVGRAGPGGSITVPLTSIAATGLRSVEPGRFAPLDSVEGRLTARLGSTVMVGTVRLRIGLFKPVDAALWATVAKSFRNLLDGAGLAAAERRVVVLGTAGEADRVLSRLPWTREGLGIGRDDFVF